MQNNFSKCREWIPRGTSQHKWRWLTTLLLILTLGIGQMWGTEYSSTPLVSLDFSSSLPAVSGVTYNGASYSSGKISWTGNFDASSRNVQITFTTTGSKFKLVLGHITSGSSMTFKYALDGGSATNLSMDKTKTSETYEISASAGSHTIKLGPGGQSTRAVVTSIAIYDEASSGPVDPTASFSNGDYTIGGSDLDLSTLFTTNSEGTVEYSISDANGTGAALRADGKSFYATTAGTATVAVAQAATSAHNAFNATATITVAACETSISGQPSNASLKVGDANPTLSVTATNVAAYAWKESSDGTSYDGSSTLSTSDSYTPSVNDAVQTKYYYCEVTSSCSGSAVVKSNIVTVEVEAADPPCAELVPATSGDAPAAGDAISLTTATGGSIKALTANLSYDANGLLFGDNSSTKAEVTLTHLMQVGTVITATIYNASDNKARGLKLLNNSGTSKATWTKTMIGDHVETYTVVAGDGLAGSNVFQLQRSDNAYLKSITVSNCGAELHALTSAIDPVAADGKATITLSKSLVAEGATATATYSAIDAAYDFDEWVVSGATIDNAKANPVTITMGSTDATITLKLKAAAVKHTVTYYDGETELGSELVNEGTNPTGAGLAPRKLGFTFTGWSTTTTGEAAALNTISVAADMPLYAVWSAVNCSAQSGTIYTMSIDVAPLANCTITSTTGTHDLYQYGGVSGGEAIMGNKGTSNNCILTTDKTIILKDDNSYLKLDFDCPLKEGDKIVYNVSGNNPFVSIATSRPSESAALAVLDRSKTEFVIPAANGLIDAQTIYVWKGGGNTTITSINIYRPAHYAVTFNMHDHGAAVTEQSVVEGGKVTEPATTDITGWDFGGWYKEDTYENEWDFANDVVNAVTELHAKWTAHVASTDATLSALTVNSESATVDALDATKYTFELPMGTTAVPTVVATPTDANAVATVTANTLSGATIEVVPESGDGDKVTYTITYSIATSKDIELVWDKTKKRCDDTTPSDNVKSDDASVSAYINKMTFTGGGEGSSLNVGNTAGNMVTLTAKPGYAISAMSFYGKIEADDAKLEYSLNGGAWTDLASTNAGDACYADVFTAAEVHELRMRSAGNKGFWIRNMQLTIIEACTPITLAWDEEPVEFEVGKSGYAIAATADNSGAVTYSSTDGDVIAVNGSTGALTVSALGSVTLKAATAEGDGTAYCANSGNDIEINKVVNTYYLVKFDAQNGDAVAEHKYYSGDAAIALPATPSYPGYDFQGWFDAETGGNQYTEAITPAASMTVYAQWVAQCAGATITTQPTGASYLTGRTPAALVCEATAGNGGALTYEWFTCDDALKTNPVAATAMPSTAVAGTFYYFCKVTEEGCAVEAFSDVVTITVADKDAICIIKSTPTSGTEATVDGVYQGNAYFKGRAADKKLNNPYDYVGVELASGYTFLATDKVVLNQTAALGTDDLSKFYVYVEEPAGGKTYVTVLNASPVQGNNWFAMPTENVGQSTLYVGRVDANCNPSVGYLAVYRESAPILSKITVNSVEGTPDNTNHVTIEVPASTTQGQLEAIAYEWVSNSDAWTATHDPAAANAWEFGVENTVTFTDKDGDASEYYITVNKAAASSDATLSALTVNGQAIALADGVFDYTFELPYGTTVVPTVVATAHHAGAVATVDPCTLSGATITVVPESGAGDQQVYTLTFTVAAWEEIVIWDGSYMTTVATSPTAETELRWATTDFGSIGSYTTTCGEKSYSKYLPSGGASTGRYMTLTVPDGYVAKFYIVMATHSDTKERGMFIGSNLVKDPDETSVLELSNNDRDVAVAGMSEIVGAGTWYINPNNSIDFQEIRAYLRPGYARTAMLGNGVLGTVCVPNNVAVEDIQGVTVYELVGREPQYGKIAFDEIVSGELEAGVPYVFQANGDKMVMFYGETKVDDPVDKGNGMYGTFVNQTLTNLDDVYYFAQRALWSCVDLTSLSLPANRAYVKLSEIDYISDPNPAPGRRRITMTVNGEKVATDVENLNASEAPVKLIIDGKMYILRGEKLFDATGRLVK